jgi:Flp pilus assembly protein TadG
LNPEPLDPPRAWGVRPIGLQQQTSRADHRRVAGRSVRRTRWFSGGRSVRRRERGAALVEFAIVFPLLFLLISGMIDFGMVFVNVNSTRQGVREGARQGVVANFGSTATCSIVGSSIPDTTRQLMCLTKERIGLSEPDTRVKVAFVGANQVGSSLLVCAQYPMSSVTGVLDPLMSGKVLTGKVEMRIEKVDLSLAAAEETPLAGKSWSWCA